LALLYGLGVSARNLLYRMGVLRSVRFSLPVISVGNIAVGGTGKSPHIEYLMRWLHQHIDVAVLSRGYGRNTEGFRRVSLDSTARETGDEPLQFKRKFPQIPVFVGESRSFGVPEVVKNHPDTQCVLLDDAFQHLAVSPGLNILLTEHARLFTRDWLLPSGRLREWRASYRRADIIVVTKCPADLTPEQRQEIMYEIDPYPRQQVFFSSYQYGAPYALFHPGIQQAITPETDVLLVSAIANTDYLIQYLRTQAKSIHSIEHEDHHYFDDGDLAEMVRRFGAIPGNQKIILTTEKDATRLELHRQFLTQHNLPVWVLPVEVAFQDADEAGFKQAVQSFLMDFKV
jgi:tetraacyldisaccharide 4'-kinase